VSAAAAAKAERVSLERIERGLRMVTVPFPHLAGLAAAARVMLDDRVPTMGVFASGRLVANPAFVARLKENELVFVLAHEMLHLALRTHDRARGADRLEFNYAHDYIINDMLRVALGFQSIPAGGLDMPGARERSAEEIVLEMRRKGNEVASRSQVWEGRPMSAGQRFPGPGGKGGRGRAQPQNDAAPEDGGDVLADGLERELYPDEANEQAARAEKMKELAAKALALAKAMGAMKGRGVEGGGTTLVVDALRGIYRTPWESALQRWLESVAPGERTFSRPSRRSVDRDDIVLPGRRREGWLLNVVLDTSASMAAEIPRALGALADFCDAVGVDQVRIVQCDTTVSADDFVAPEALAQYQVTGYGGSDLSPALLHLAEDPQTRAVVAITDGDVALPAEAMPYSLLWLLPANGSPSFRPPYGRVLQMQRA
jgi:predicted metal-dependent peptidase